MKFSPLFWPIKLKGNTIYVLDETALPRKLTYIKVKTYLGAVRVIRQMKTRAVGQVALVFYTFLLVIRQNKKKDNIIPLLKRVAKALNTARPTLPFKVLTDMVLDWATKGSMLEQSILNFLEMIKMGRIHQAGMASRLLNDGDVVLTHCNVSGSLALIGEYCRKEKKKVTFFVTETRPYFQGARLTSWELKEQGFDVTVVADNTVAYLMSNKMINKVIVGADQLALNGDIANKIGTYQIALLAQQFQVPFYVLCPPPSQARSGREINIEVRSDKELLEYQGKRIAPKDVKGYYPAFDITPNALITQHIKMGL